MLLPCAYFNLAFFHSLCFFKCNWTFNNELWSSLGAKVKVIYSTHRLLSQIYRDRQKRRKKEKREEETHDTCSRSKENILFRVPVCTKRSTQASKAAISSSSSSKSCVELKGEKEGKKSFSLEGEWSWRVLTQHWTYTREKTRLARDSVSFLSSWETRGGERKNFTVKECTMFYVLCSVHNWINLRLEAWVRLFFLLLHSSSVTEWTGSYKEKRKRVTSY